MERGKQTRASRNGSLTIRIREEFRSDQGSNPSKIPIPRVEGCGFDSEIIRQTLLQAAVDQKSIRAVTDSIRGTYSDDYTLAQLHTVPRVS